MIRRVHLSRLRFVEEGTGALVGHLEFVPMRRRPAAFSECPWRFVRAEGPGEPLEEPLFPSTEAALVFVRRKFER